MRRKFPVSFKNEERIYIRDIIEFELEQIREIIELSKDLELTYLRKGKKYGIPLSYITDQQMNTVLSEKNIILKFKTSEEILDQKIIKFGEHSLKRILERKGSIKKTVLISLLDKVKGTNKVTGAQFKGYPTLSYTLIVDGDPDEETFAVSFVSGLKSRKILKMITVHLKKDEPEEKEYRVSEAQPDYFKKLADIKEVIISELKKNS